LAQTAPRMVITQ